MRRPGHAASAGGRIGASPQGFSTTGYLDRRAYWRSAHLQRGCGAAVRGRAILCGIHFWLLYIAADIASAPATLPRARFAVVPRREPGSRTCAAIALGVHIGPWRQAAESYRQEWSRTSAAPPGTTAQTSSVLPKLARPRVSIADADLAPA